MVLLFGLDIGSFFTSFGIFFCLFLIISLTLNLEFGYTGIPNFGKAMFVAAGGAIGGAFAYRFAEYVFAIPLHGDDISFNPIIASQINGILSGSILLSIGILLVTLVVAAGFGGLLGFLASYPAIRLREDYLGMLLLASGEFFRIFLIGYYPLIGGSLGVQLPDIFAWSSFTIGLRDQVALLAFGILAVGVYFYVERVGRSPLGRMLRAIRENEVATEALGKDNVSARRRVLIIAAALSAMAGALYSMYLAHVDPDQFQRGVFTFWPWLIVILGGSASNPGVVVGAAAFIGTNNVIIQYAVAAQSSGAGFFLPIGIQRLQPIAFGLLLIIVLLVRPSGIIREKKTRTISKSKLISFAGGAGNGAPARGGSVGSQIARRLRKFKAPVKKT